MQTIQVRLFGAFRNLGQSEVTVPIPTPSVTVTEMKSILVSHFGELKASFDASSLVGNSVLANDTDVLEDHDMVASGSRLALLPPVSGG